MKRWILTWIFCLLLLPGVAQTTCKHFQITKDIELIQLTKNAYLHISRTTFSGYGRIPCNGLVLTNKNEAFLFDTPATETMTKELVTWQRDSLKVNPIGFIPNHWHSDCMGGLAWLQTQKIKSYANQLTIDIARKEKLPLPDQGFSDSLHLRLGNQKIACYYLGAAHSLDNIVVWIPSGKILFAGCMVKSLESTNLGNTADGDKITYPKTIRKLLAKFPTAKIVIPGHGAYGGQELIRHTLELAEKK